MLRLILPLPLVLFIFSATAAAQQLGGVVRSEPRREVPSISIGEVAPTPEMWFYVQELRRQDDPKEYVRQMARVEQAQRQARIASRQWYGYSNARPTASPTPFTGDWSYHWTSNSYMPYQWIDGGSAATVIVTQPGAVIAR